MFIHELDNIIFWQIFRWVKRQCPRKSVDWFKQRYYCSGIHRAFVYPVKGIDGTVKFRQLYMLADKDITDTDQVAFAVHVPEKLRSDSVVMARLQNNTMDQAMKVDLPTKAIQVIAGAMSSHAAERRGDAGCVPDGGV